VKALWAVLGLVPSALVVTGALMWWNRVVRKALGAVNRTSVNDVAHHGARDLS
jgi:uncharacterized iron-regulated membrane protein